MAVENGRPEAFFWAAKSKTLVWIVPGGNAIRPGPCYDGQNSVSTVFRSETLSYDSPLTVWYRVSGTATNGVKGSVNENVMLSIASDRACHPFSRAVQEDWVRT